MQGVDINDKHVEVITRQMLRKVRIEEPGDTDLLIGSLVDMFEFNEANKALDAKGGGTHAVASPVPVSYTHLGCFKGFKRPWYHKSRRRGTRRRYIGRQSYSQG